MGQHNSEVRQRPAQLGGGRENAQPQTNADQRMKRTAQTGNQTDSDLTFYAFCAAVFNTAAALIVSFNYGLDDSGSPDELSSLLRTSVLSMVIASVAGTTSWKFPILGTAFLGGVLLGVGYLFVYLAVFGDDDSPISIYFHGWMASSALLYGCFKSKIWTPF